MIRVLAPEVQNQIAAGEVVERPASVVKELVENALDAGATKIVVEIEEGGTSTIRVTDNGVGCAKDDLPLAFVAHATSKLSALEDLDRIGSLGFRGEALAAIGSVARCRMTSRVRGTKEAWQVESVGGSISALRPSAGPEGTSLEVRDLFFNTPARRRFLKAAYAERARIQEIVARIVVPRLDVDFTLLSDGKPLLRLPAGAPFADRVAAAFGATLREGMRSVAGRLGSASVEGVLVDPDRARADATLELCWINGRFAKDRSSTMAVRQAFRQHLMHGRFPVYFLQLSLPPDEVDVNVHPQKAEVRFANPRLVAGLLHGAVARALQGTAPEGTMPTGELGASAEAAPAEGVQREANPGIAIHPDLPRARSSTAADWPLFRPLARAAQPDPRVAEPSAAPAPLAPPPNPFRELASPAPLQVLDLYLVLAGRDGLVVVDQHALHERVLYERFKKRHESAPVLVQRLLAPEVVEVSPGDKAWLLEVKDELATEGLLIDDFGGHAVAIHGLPALLGRTKARRLVETLLAAEGQEDARPRARAAVAERFHSMACRAAVMSGDRLSAPEIEALLQDARTLDHPHHCPHGRPTILTFGRTELERYFKRRT